MARPIRCSSNDIVFTDEIEIELDNCFFRLVSSCLPSLNIPTRQIGGGFSWSLAFSYKKGHSNKYVKCDATFYGNPSSRVMVSLESNKNVLRSNVNSIDKTKCQVVETSLNEGELSFNQDGRFILKIAAVCVLHTTLSCSNAPLKLLPFSELLDKTDLTLTVGAEKITAHKCILKKISSVISAMFDHDTKEARDNNIDIVDFDFETVDNAIDYIYGMHLCVFMIYSRECLKYVEK